MVLCIVLLTSACGASDHTQELRTSLVALNVARDTLRATSKAHEQQLVDDCDPPRCTQAEGHAQLEEWRERVDKITAIISEGYDAILAASILDDDQSAGLAGTVVKKALELIKDLKNPTLSEDPSEHPSTAKETP